MSGILSKQINFKQVIANVLFKRPVCLLERLMIVNLNATIISAKTVCDLRQKHPQERRKKASDPSDRVGCPDTRKLENHRKLDAMSI